MLLLLATGAVVIFYLLIALNPTSALNPFPPRPASPPTPFPLLTFGQERGGGGGEAAGGGVRPTPTPLHPATLTPTPEPVFPFTATVETGPVSRTLDCRAMLIGAVLDREGHGLEGYPVHIWTTEHGTRNTDDRVLFSDPSGRWQAVLPAGAHGLWYVQLHAPDARQFYPPLSAIIAVAFPDACSQAVVLFREQSQ